MPENPKPKDTLTDGTPKALSKHKFCNVYNLVTSLQHVVIQPFTEQLMLNELMQSFLSQTDDYCIKKSSISGATVALLKFRSIEYGDAAYMSIKESFEDATTRVFHPKVDEDDALKTLDRHTVDIDYYVDALLGTPAQLSERGVIIENMPQSDQDELLNEFTEALNVLDFTCDDTVVDVAVLEMKSKAAAQAFVEEKNGSTFKSNTLCVSLLQGRLRQLSDKYLSFSKKTETVHSFLNDKERMEKVRDILALDQEKEELESKMDLIGLQKFYRYKEINKTYDELRRSLFTDARRRYEKDLKMPEDDLPLSESQRRIMSGRGIFAKKPNFNGNASANVGMKRMATSPHSAPPTKKFTPAPMSRGGRGGGRGGFTPRPGLQAQSNNERFIQSLSKKVQELTSEVKGMGLDPTVRPRLDCVHGLGLNAKGGQEDGNPVVQALTNRIRELNSMLGRSSDATAVVDQIRQETGALPSVARVQVATRATPLLALDTSMGRGAMQNNRGARGGFGAPMRGRAPMGGGMAFGGRGAMGRGSLLGSAPPMGNMGGGPPTGGGFGAHGGGGGGYDEGYSESPMEDVGATIGQLRTKLAELGSRLNATAGASMHGGSGDMGVHSMMEDTDDFGGYNNAPAMGMQQLGRGMGQRGGGRGMGAQSGTMAFRGMNRGQGQAHMSRGQGQMGRGQMGRGQSRGRMMNSNQRGRAW